MCANFLALTSAAKFNFFRSPPDNVEIRLLATFCKPNFHINVWIRWSFRARDQCRSNCSSPMKYKCSFGVKQSMVISNWGTKHDTLVILLCLMGLPFSNICPLIAPRKRCETLAKSVVLPAPLEPKIAIKFPDSIWPLTGKRTKHNSYNRAFT